MTIDPNFDPDVPRGKRLHQASPYDSRRRADIEWAPVPNRTGIHDYLMLASTTFELPDIPANQNKRP
jgi:hypothetical protein